MIIVEETLTLKTSRTLFWDALKNYTLTLPFQSFPTETGRIVVMWPKPDGDNEMVCKGSHYVRQDERTEYGCSIGIVMSFAAFPQVKGEIDMIARCWQEPVVDYFKELLTMLANLDESDAHGSTLPPIEDPTDKRIFDLVTDDPDLTDKQIAQYLGITRQAVNSRRRRLKLMGYKVR